MHKSLSTLSCPPLSRQPSSPKHSCIAPVAILWITGLLSLSGGIHNEQGDLINSLLGILLSITAVVWSLLLIPNKTAKHTYEQSERYLDDPLLTLKQQLKCLANENQAPLT